MAETDKLKVTIVTPEGEKLDCEADEIVAPGFEGQFGVMPEHIEFFTKSPPGVFVCVRQGTREVWAVGKGFIEVQPGAVRLLVQTAERKENIDRQRAEASLHRAEDTMSKLDGNLDDPDWTEQELRLKRAEARLGALAD